MTQSIARLSFLMLTIFTLSAPALGANRGASTDVTPEFLAMWNAEGDSSAGEASAEIVKLREFHVVFVGGFLANAGSVLGLRPPFQTQRQELETFGISHSIAPILPAGTVAANAAILIEELEKAAKPVVLFTFSKGTLDAMEAFRFKPELARKVRGWWMQQSPIYGTPVADYFESGALPILAADFLISLIGGDSAAIADMTTAGRVEYMRANAGFFGQLSTQIKILSFGAWKDDEFLTWDTDFELLRDFMVSAEGLENDGLVPWKSAIYPAGESIAVEGIDHVAAIHSSRWIDLDRARFTRVLLKLVGKRLL